MERQDFELQETGEGTDVREPDQRVEFFLPPVDSGKDAWLLLAGAFVVEGLCWGWAFSYGIFQEHYSRLDLFKDQQAQVPLVGTVCTGIMYLCSPLALLLLRRYANRRRQTMVAGLGVVCVSFIAASFANTVSHLIITQGVLAGVGSSMTYYPVFLFIDEWFVQRKGIAYGVCWAASGFTGLVLPFIISWSLDRYSFRTTFRAWAIANVILLPPAFTVLKPRLPYSTTVGQYRLRLSFVRNTFFVITCGANIIEALGHTIPSLYLPSYAVTLGLSTNVGTTSVAVFNIATSFGYIFGGYLTDRWPSNLVIAYSTICGALTILFLWGFSANSASIIAFSVVYAFFVASFLAAWPGVIKHIIRNDITRSADPGIIFGFLIAARGIGNIICGPLSQVLLRLPRLTDDFDHGYGSSYGWLILFAAAAVALGGTGPCLEGLGVLNLHGQ